MIAECKRQPEMKIHEHITQFLMTVKRFQDVMLATFECFSRMLANHETTHAKKCVARMKMLRWMYGKTRKDSIWEHVWMASIGGDKLIESCLRLFGHIQCWPTTWQLEFFFSVPVDGPSRDRRRLKRIWMEVVMIDLKKCKLSEVFAHDRMELQNRFM